MPAVTIMRVSGQKFYYAIYSVCMSIDLKSRACHRNLIILDKAFTNM